MNKNLYQFPSIIVLSIRGTKYKLEDKNEERQEIAQIGWAEVKNNDGTPYISANCNVDIKTKKILSIEDKTRIGFHLESEQTETVYSVYNHLQKEYNIKEVPWASWGDFERKIISQTHDKTKPYPFNGRHLNLKTIYGILRTGFSEIPFHKVMKELKLRKEFDEKGNFAGADAFLTAHVLIAIMKSIEVQSDRDYRDEE